MSGMMMRGLICFYMVIATVSAFEKNWPRVLYWLSAAALTISVLWGSK